ncbi:O-methyltransferase [Acinetobacter qingfengensis]|uniref:Methyltransferase n=1 Tax=Acinetobacter qingfengensis TaxID=1262585 RepID=A0A1E7QYP4_9GAMM|nr:O-methyltransferase [Acinetobacter qingfengensis]KAA8731403.1 O-methyltransferase [Acinetobacter qingfengensis]OEY92192.1 methyltransferase [Acinetobacter qingfengensis]
MLNPDQNTWTAVDQYIEQHLIPENPILQKALDHTAERGFPGHLHVAPNQGAFLAMLIQMNQCKRILELGTFAAYSTIYMAQALAEDGYILTIEGRDTHIALAQENINTSGYSQIIDARLGRAMDVLRELPTDTPPFDFIFIDADKQSYPEYLELCLSFSHSGTIIVMDNVIRAAEIINPDNQKPSITGLRELFQLLDHHPKLATCTALQTVGCKGYDGFAIAIVK